jgi:hypothetical protein
MTSVAEAFATSRPFVVADVDLDAGHSLAAMKNAAFEVERATAHGPEV